LSREMTVGELRELLEDESEDMVVRIVHQLSWPLQEVVGGVVSSREIVDDDDDDQEDEAATAASDTDEDATSVLYLVANGHPEKDSPYGPRGAWDVMRRGRW
jgi:hypothetical protein